jgi:hypothetical protein
MFVDAKRMIVTTTAFKPMPNIDTILSRLVMVRTSFMLSVVVLNSLFARNTLLMGHQMQANKEPYKRGENGRH